MKRSGQADLPLHYGKVPPWLYERMATLGGAIAESIVIEYGRAELLKRLSDPFWFQAFGAVLGMDWHSSGITTSVLGALKKAIAPMSEDLGIYICGGKGKHSLQTPAELLKISDKTGLDGNYLTRCSKLSAKVDNTAIQDGFNLYLHSFILSKEGDWAVVQQGMNENTGYARRYHWHSANIESFTEDPHTSIFGLNQGQILNLTDKEAAETKAAILQLTTQYPELIINEYKKLVMPERHQVKDSDVDIKRLGAVLALANDSGLRNFESLLLLKGIGPRAIQSLTLVSEVIHGTPSRFSDPARFAFAHGGKDRKPFAVPTKIYDDTIIVLQNSVEKAKMGFTEKQGAIKRLTVTAQRLEDSFIPQKQLQSLIRKENRESWKHGGRSIFGVEKPPKGKKNPNQLDLGLE
jgi:uncharacterized protein